MIASRSRPMRRMMRVVIVMSRADKTQRGVCLARTYIGRNCTGMLFHNPGVTVLDDGDQAETIAGDMSLPLGLSDNSP